METSFKLSRREKTDLILRYLRRCLGLFSVALVCACLSMVLNAVTPQIIKITVDSILRKRSFFITGIQFHQKILPAFCTAVSRK